MKKILGKIMNRFAAILIMFAFLLTTIMAMTSFNLTKSSADLGIENVSGMLKPLTASIDSYFLNTVENPMEEMFDHVGFIGFCFSSPDWPAGKALVNKVRDELSEFVAHSAYIKTAFVYTSATDKYATSLNRFNVYADQEMDPYFKDVIYAYNSGSSEKQMLRTSKHLTFLFQYEGNIYITKDLNTSTGNVFATLFVCLDIDGINRELSSMTADAAPYSFYIYSKNLDLIFSSNTLSSEEDISAPEPSKKKSDIDLIGDEYYFYYTSEQFSWQYLIVMDQSALNLQPGIVRNNWLMAGLCMLGLIGAFCLFIYLYLKKPAGEIFDLLDNASPIDIKKNPVQVLRVGTQSLSEENDRLRAILEYTSDEVLKTLFSELIGGKHYSPEEISRILSYSNAGFGMNDVYVAGVLRIKDPSLLNMELRSRIQEMLDECFREFKKDNSCNSFAFSVDLSCFALIVSFPSGRSIAEGKTLTTALSQLIHAHLRGLKLDTELYFGHLYHSVLDIGFSYNEAARSTSEQIGQISPVILEPADDKEAVPQTIDLEHLDRRSKQIVELVYNNKEKESQDLLARTLENLFNQGSYEERSRTIKVLLSAVIEKMVSYEFVSSSQFSDVTSKIYEAIDQKAPDHILKDLLSDSIGTLCTEFSEVLKKQRNPYIQATLEYIGQHYSDPNLSLDEISEALGVAPNYLSNLFSRNLGVKLFDYINDYRIRKSLELLTNTDKTVNDISLLSGFGTSRNYIRVFKKYMNSTPGAYRKEKAGIM